MRSLHSHGKIQLFDLSQKLLLYNRRISYCEFFLFKSHIVIFYLEKTPKNDSKIDESFLVTVYFIFKIKIKYSNKERKGFIFSKFMFENYSLLIL